MRTDIDYDNLSKEVAALGPLGSVIKTAEDFVDDDNEEAMYGVSSVVVLSGEKVMSSVVYDYFVFRIMGLELFWLRDQRRMPRRL